MSIKISISARKNPLKPLDPPKYFATAQTREVIDIQRIARELAFATAMTEGDVYNVLRNLPYKIKEHAADGDMVDLGLLGKFSYNVSSKGALTRQEFNHHQIKKVRFQFTPGKLMIESLDKLEFEEVVTIKEMQEAKRQSRLK